MDAQNAFLGLRTVVYHTPDLAAAKAWYSKLLNQQPYFDEPFYVGFQVGGYELGLHPAEGAVQTGTAITYWGVPDVAAVWNQMLEAGATALEEPHEVGGGIVVAAVRDPWGNALGIIYNPHFTLPG